MSATSTRYTPEQRLFLYTKRENNTSYRQIHVEFQQRFNIPSPTEANIRLIHRKVSTEYTAHNLCRGRSGRSRSERTDENYMLLMGDICTTPKIGIRQRVPSLGLTVIISAGVNDMLCYKVPASELVVFFSVRMRRLCVYNSILHTCHEWLNVEIDIFNKIVQRL